MTREVGRLSHGRHPHDPERKISLVRLLILFALLPILWWDVVTPETELVLIGLTALIAGYILAALLILPRMRRVLREDLFLTIDILAITALVWYTDGIRSSLLFLFYLPILTAAIRLDLRQAILSAVAVSGMVVWMWRISEGALPSLGSATVRVGLFAGSSLVLAFFFSVLAQESRMLRHRARMNLDLNDRLAEAGEQLRRRVSELEFAYDLSRRLAGATETGPVLVTVAEAARQLLRAPYAAVFLTNHLGGELVTAHAAGLNEGEAGPIMAACASRVTADSAGPLAVEVDHNEVWARATCVPIVSGGRLLGVLCAGGGGDWKPARHSVAVLGHVAGQAGIALDRASLMEELQRLAMAKPDAQLFDRRQFDRILRKEIARATQLGVPFALLKLAVGNLNHAPKRDGGKVDPVHRRLAELTLNSVRRGDVIALDRRGEVFVLLSMASLAAAQKFAARLLAQLGGDAALARLLGAAPAVDVRAGIAMFPQDALAAAELAYAAQNALESAKVERPVVCAHELDV